MFNKIERPLTFLRLKQIIERTGLSRSTIYKMIQEGKFPRQVDLVGGRSVAWVENEIENWMKHRLELRNNKG